jgi:hypothetical protein
MSFMSTEQLSPSEQSSAEGNESNGHGASAKPPLPEMMPISLLGTTATKSGTKLNVYSTLSKKHVLMCPVEQVEGKGVIGTPVKIVDLPPKLRQRLGC